MSSGWGDSGRDSGLGEGCVAAIGAEFPLSPAWLAEGE